ncbi:MAG: hypothetical protein DVB22_002560 [Verrucomicrobia bacterium]|nr:MAG: hypothetical protein DVB22_002560 [Verrucomicrobiota bacterium]
MDPLTIKDVREGTLRYLYQHPGLALSLKSIARAVRREGVEVADADLAQQLAVLTTGDLIAEVPDPTMPAVRSYQITAQGITHVETHLQ